MDPNKIKISRNFFLSEYQSPDTKEVIIYPELIKKVQLLRDYRVAPIILTSAYRTNIYHRLIYKKKYPETWKKIIPWGSFHLSGKAVDISLKKHEPIELFKLAKKAEFKGLILNIEGGYLHADIRAEEYYHIIT